MKETRTPSASAEKVINSPDPALARARVDCLHSSQSSSQSGFKKPISSQTTGARARVREGQHVKNPTAYFKAWRQAKWGDDFDPVRAAVDEAVIAFSPGKSAEAQENDRRIWLKIANRIGLDCFLDAFDQKNAELRELEARGKRLANPAASFQKLLNRRFPKGGAR